MVKVILFSLIANAILFVFASGVEITTQPFDVRLDNPTRGVAVVVSLICFFAIYTLGSIDGGRKSTERYIDGYNAGVDDCTERINKKLKELGLEAKFEKK